jgi:hypothetical protein
VASKPCAGVEGIRHTCLNGHCRDSMLLTSCLESGARGRRIGAFDRCISQEYHPPSTNCNLPKWHVVRLPQCFGAVTFALRCCTCLPFVLRRFGVSNTRMHRTLYVGCSLGGHTSPLCIDLIHRRLRLVQTTRSAVSDNFSVFNHDSCNWGGI